MDCRTKKQLDKERRAKAAKDKRARIRNNPIEKAKEQLRRHLRYEKAKENGSVLLMKDLSKKEAATRRKKNRQSYKLRKQKKLNQNNDLM